MNRRALIAGLFALALLAVVWSWWAWKDGAYFGVVLLPGTIVLCAGMAIFARVAPSPGALLQNRPAAVALGALVALGAWTGLSALWSPAPDIALVDAQRVFVYALSFGLGIWLAVLLGARVQFALAPLAVAGAFAGAVAVGALLTGDRPLDYMETDASFDFPLGYRNANAAFFAIALFPAIGLASDPGLDWRARGAALGAATLCLDLALLSQSRGSIPAAVIALAVYVLASPLRVRAIVWLALAVLPALGVLPALTDLYRAANDEGIQTVVNEMRSAGVAVLVTVGVAAALGSLVARLERGLPGLRGSSPAGNRAVLVGAAGLAAALAIGFVVKVGDPVDWVGERADEFRGGGAPDLTAGSSRFSLNLESDRYDLWRVALDDAGEDPLLGDGAGGYQYSYLQKREAVLQTARDAHSVELEVLSELGIPGLALLLCAVGGAAFGMVRARLRGFAAADSESGELDLRAASVAAIALTSGAYWFAHTSIDWFWPYAGVTAPVFALAGSACAAGMRPGQPRSGARRRWILAGVIVLAISAVPFFLSERYVNSAYAEWRTDLERAYDDLDRAQALNPFSDTPLLAEGAIADAAGDRQRALAAFREAAEDRPEEWASHFLLAELYASEQPELARQELELARELNPLSEEVRILDRELERAP